MKEGVSLNEALRVFKKSSNDDTRDKSLGELVDSQFNAPVEVAVKETAASIKLDMANTVSKTETVKFDNDIGSIEIQAYNINESENAIAIMCPNYLKFVPKFGSSFVMEYRGKKVNVLFPGTFFKYSEYNFSLIVFMKRPNDREA